MGYIGASQALCASAWAAHQDGKQMLQATQREYPTAFQGKAPFEEAATSTCLVECCGDMRSSSPMAQKQDEKHPSAVACCYPHAEAPFDIAARRRAVQAQIRMAA